MACNMSLVVVYISKSCIYNEACYKLVCLVNGIFEIRMFTTRVVYVIQIYYYYSLLLCMYMTMN